MSNEIRKIDDYFHTSGKDFDWRESYYFNFVNHDNMASGFTTIGILPNQKKAEYVLSLFYDDKQMLYYKEQELSADDKGENQLSNKILTYSLIEPLEKWEIEFSGQEIELLIRWKARFPPFNFGKGSGTSWTRHFEQSGLVKGRATFRNGKEIPIEGYGQRDKSWGQRNWHVENWFAFHAQFEKYAIGIRKDTVNGVPYVSGGCSTTKNQIHASEVDLEIFNDGGQNKTPVGALTTVHYIDGRAETIKSKLVSPNSFVNFTRSFSNGTTELFEGMAIHDRLPTGEKGTGLIEFLFTRTKPQLNP
jgi:hypothetical protein